MVDNFARCKEISITVAAEIPDSKIFYGLYFPITPKNKWDPRWQGAEFFTHFWVEVDKHIIDAAKEQFGEPFVSIIPNDDIRYVKMGEYNVKKDTIRRLVFEPYIKNPGSQKERAKIVWDGYDAHMERIRALRI